jgi:AcrR family transcriptional regulator
MLELVETGNLIPTAQQVADKAGVAIRTVFRHFSDMESLFAELDSSIRPCYEGLFTGGDRSGNLEERVLHAVERHANAYNTIAPITRSTLVQLWRWPIIKETYARTQHSLRLDLDDWLPELKQVPTETREAIDAIASFEFWDRLRSQQGLSYQASIALIVNLIMAQL